MMENDQYKNIPVIRPVALTKYSNVVCGVSTRIGGVSNVPYGLNLSFSVGDNESHVVRNREIFFGQMQVSLGSLATPKQIHGKKVERVYGPGTYDGCDGLITNEKDTFLAVSVADCLPVFLYDPVHNAIGAVHSGWKGSQQKILSVAIFAMSDQFNSQPKSLNAFLGQSAGVCCYEVGDEVAALFDDSFVERKPGKKPHLDLKKYNRDLLIRGGLDPVNIELLSDCTICNPEKYHSFRRDGKVSGRMMGVIGLKTTVL